MCLALGVRLGGFMNSVDEFIYIGAAERLRDFLQRWPDTYYAVRFGYLVPEVLFERVLGPDVGYVGLRLALLGLAVSILRMRGMMPLSAAFLGSIIFASSPLVLATAFNTYPISLGMLFIVIGSGCLATCSAENGTRALWRPLVGGFVLALAWNSHFALLPICAVVIGVFAIDEVLTSRSSPILARCKLVAISVGGTVAAVVLGVILYRWKFGVSNLYAPTLSQASQDTNPFFLERSFDWLTWRHYLLIGPLALVVGSVAWASELNPEIRRPLRRLTLTTAVSFAVYAAFEWLDDVPLLSIFFYASVPLALAVFTLAWSLAAAASRLTRRQQQTFIPGLCVAVLLCVRFASAIEPSYPVVVALTLLVSVAIVAARLRRSGTGFLLLSAAMITATFVNVSSPHDFPAATGGFRTDPHYDDVLFAYESGSLDQIRVAREFARSLPSLPTNRGEIRIWFDSVGPTNLVVSTMVWYRSALQGEGEAPMPSVTATVVNRVTIDRPRYIVVVDEAMDDVRRGIEEVQRLSPYRIVWQKHFQHGDSSVNATLLERTDGAWADFPALAAGDN
jgi:hypothetical protein